VVAELKKKLSKLPAPKVAIVPKEQAEEMFEELLGISCEGAMFRAEMAALATEMNWWLSVEEIADCRGQICRKRSGSSEHFL